MKAASRVFIAGNEICVHIVNFSWTGRTPFKYPDLTTVKVAFVSITFSEKDHTVYESREKKLVIVQLQLLAMGGLRIHYFSGRSVEDVETA